MFFFLLCFSTVRTPEGQIKLYCKGADTVIFEHLDVSSEDLMHPTTEHLNVRFMIFHDKCAIYIFFFIAKQFFFVVIVFLFGLFQLQEFAGEGLRTLALAYKDLDEDYFDVWMKKLLYASTILENRDEHLAVLYEEIEQDLKVKQTSLAQNKNIM